MADPQIEHGYARIANELLEALAKYSPGHGEMQVFMAIMRKTYGWRKKMDAISIGQLVEMTGLSRRRVIVCLGNLEAKKMVKIYRKQGRGKNEVNRIEIQKNYDLWVVTEKSDSYRKDLEKRSLRYKKSKTGVVSEIKKAGGSVGNGEEVVSETDKKCSFPSPTKDTIQKTLTKNPPISPQGDESKNVPDSGRQKISPEIQQVFDAWNQHAGRSVNKPNGHGTMARITWKAHNKLGKEKLAAIRHALQDYSVEEIIGAIDNFSSVLLGRDCFWSYPWTLDQFLSRGRERHKNAERLWWQFLPDNFDAERYRRYGAESEVVFGDPTIEEAEEIARRLDRQAAARGAAI